MRAEVVVVSKTRMRGGRVCVGGYILENFRSVRLLGSDKRNMPANTQLEIGDVWELEFEPLTDVVAPHLEDVVVASGQRVREVEDLDNLLRTDASPWIGPLTQIFEGCLRRSSTGKLGVPVGGSQPSGSTGLWIVDFPLITVRDKDQHDRYRSVIAGAAVTVPYVGLSPIVPTLSTGTLLRMSLARPFLERCWLQISGWYGNPAIRKGD